MEAPAAEAVASQLLAGEMTPVEIATAPSKSDLLAELRAKFGRGSGVELTDQILFCRQMHTLVKAGVPIVRSLRGMIDTTRNPAFAEVLRGVTEDLESGRDLSAGLGRHPEAFPVILTRMVQVGEYTGRLEEAFAQIAKYLELEKETRNRLKAALRYPTFVLVAIAVAIGILSFFVIPTFQRVFAHFGARLPLPTRIILGISDFSVAYWPYLLGTAVLGVFGVRRYLNTEAGRYRWDRLKLKLPLVGSIILRATLTRFARGFAMGYSAGVPLVQSLSITARAVDNAFVGERIEQMRNSIERGETLTRSAAAAQMFTPLVLQMLAVGEETGAVDTMLLEVAEFYEREVDYDLDNLASAIEPVMIVAIGVMVLILALGVFLPMWNLISVVH